jgi:signal peptidase I
MVGRMADSEENSRSGGWVQAVLIGRNPERTAMRIAILVLGTIIVAKFVLLPIRVEGASMLPTYQNDRVNFVNRLAYLWHEPRRGDVVAIRTSGFSIMYMKRIIGLPGEQIEFRRGHAFINGQELPEPYVKNPCRWNIPPRTLGADEYYFVGDNRSMPHVDHMKGVASRNRIVGKVLL